MSDRALWTLRIIGLPKPQARPRAFSVKNRAGGVFTRVHSPVTDWRHTVYAQAVASRPATPFAGALGVTMDFYMPRPKARKKDLWHVTRPDASNLVKAVEDALNDAQVWADDSLVAHLVVRKLYATEQEPSGAAIWLRGLE